MRWVKRLQTAVFVWSLSAHPVMAAPADAYKVPKEELQKTIRTIALRPVILPAGSVDAETVQSQIEALIVEKLVAKGFKTIPSTEFAQIWTQLAQRSGGVYDPITGESDKKKLEAVRDHTLRELARQHHADAVLGAFVYLDVWTPGLTAGLPGHYYAADETITWQGQPLQGVNNDPINMPQKVVETYLGVSLMDLSAVRVYSASSYIELLKVYVARGYEEKPRSQLYGTQRIQRAVNAVMEPFFSPDAKFQ